MRGEYVIENQKGGKLYISFHGNGYAVVYTESINSGTEEAEPTKLRSEYVYILEELVERDIRYEETKQYDSLEYSSTSISELNRILCGDILHYRHNKNKQFDNRTKFILLDNKKDEDGKRVPGTYRLYSVRASETLDTTNHKKPRLLTWDPINDEVLLGREKELNEIYNKLNRSRIVYLSGLDGIGKTFLATHYATRYSQEYGQKICLRCSGELLNAFISDDQGLNISPLSYTSDDKHIRFREKYKVLRDLCENKKTLFVIDNIDYSEENRDCLNILTDIPNAHFIITSRDDRWEKSLSILTGSIGIENLFCLFCSWYGSTPKDEENISAIYNIIQYTGCHTLTVKLIALQAEADDVVHTPAAKFDELIHAGLKGNAIEVDSSRTILENLSVLFNVQALEPAAEQLLFDIILCSPAGISTNLLSKVRGTGTQNLLNKLRHVGWIERIKGFDFICYSIHPMIAQVIMSNEEELSHNFFYSFISALHKGDISPTKETAFFMTMAQITENIIKYKLYSAEAARFVSDLIIRSVPGVLINGYRFCDFLYHNKVFDSLTEAMLSHALGRINGVQVFRRDDAGLNYYLEALLYCDKLDDQYEYLTDLLLELAIIMLIQDKYHEADGFIQCLKDEITDPFAKASALGIYGMSLALSEAPRSIVDELMSDITELIDGYSDNDDSEEIIASLFEKKAIVCACMGNKNQALICINEAQTRFRRCNDPNQERVFVCELNRLIIRLINNERFDVKSEIKSHIMYAKETFGEYHRTVFYCYRALSRLMSEETDLAYWWSIFSEFRIKGGIYESSDSETWEDCLVCYLDSDKL